MFKEQPAFYIQKEENFKKQKLVYSINNNDKIIGTIQETQSSTKKGDFLVKLFSLLFLTMPKRAIIESVEMELLDKDNNLLGMITKGTGFYKDLFLYTKSGEHIATVQSRVKLKSPSITVFKANGTKLIKATGSYPSTDFSVIDCRTNRQISSVKKRSLVYSSIKENLFKNDVYHFSNNNEEDVVTFALIGMGVALDIYFHMGE